MKTLRSYIIYGMCLTVATAAIVLSALPFQPFFGSGRITREAFWSLGYGPLSFTAGALLIIGAVTLIKGMAIGKKIIFWWGVLIAIIFSALIIKQGLGSPLLYITIAIVLGALWAAIIRVLSFENRSV